MTKTNSFKGLSILYLEDEPLISLDTSEFLSEMGFGNIVTVFKLHSAEMAVSETKFDFALLDINVDKGQTSFELGERLAKTGVPVMFASGNSNDADDLISRGYRFIDKPFNLLALQSEIVSFLDPSNST